MNHVKEFINLIENHHEQYNFSDSDVNILKKAALYAEKYHKGQKRKSGEDYIMHPIAVGKLLMSWSLDVNSIIAGILHDLIEDTPVTYEDIVKEFGEDVGFLVNSVSKVSIFSSENRKQDLYNEEDNQYLLQVFMNMCSDIRVLFVKIADRYHNMKTIEFLKHDRQVRMARETIDIYATLAGRVGMYSIKTELQDMCFKILEPEQYDKISEFIETTKNKYVKTFDNFVEKVKFLLKHNNLNADVFYRIKSVYSTHEKMKINGNVNDLFAIRIITDNILDCYLVLGILNLNFFYNKDSFKDFISNPKSNLYQTIHTSVMFEEVRIEIQIRTKIMDDIANYGLASHWRYKENTNALSSINEFTSKIYNELTEADDVQEKINIIKHISQKTPINIFDINLGKWATTSQDKPVIDYVYHNHRNQFIYLEEVYVNGTPASLYQILEAADNIKLTFAQTPTVSKSWSNITRDIHVKKFIANSLSKVICDAPTNEKELIQLLSQKSSQKINKTWIKKFIFENFELEDIHHFIKIIQTVKLTSEQVIDLFINKNKKIISDIHDNMSKSVIDNFYFLPIESYFKNVIVTKCCSKLPPVQVVGILNKDTLYIHNYECQKIKKLNENINNATSDKKLIVLHWDKEKIKKENRTFPATIIMQGGFSQNVSTLIINTILRYRADIKSFFLKKDKQLYKKYTIRTTLYVKNINQLEKIHADLLKSDLIESWKLL